MKQRWVLLGTIGIALVAVVAGVRLIAYPFFVGTADKVQITVTQRDASLAPKTIFAQSFTSQAQKILTQITSGVQMQSASSRCPSISATVAYYHYSLTFWHLGKRIATAESDAQGCAIITLTYFDGTTGYYSWETPQKISLWDVLYQLAGVPRPINMCTNATCS